MWHVPHLKAPAKIDLADKSFAHKKLRPKKMKMTCAFKLMS